MGAGGRLRDERDEGSWREEDGGDAINAALQEFYPQYGAGKARLSAEPACFGIVDARRKSGTICASSSRATAGGRLDEPVALSFLAALGLGHAGHVAVRA